MPNEEYLFAIDKYGKLRINPKYEINLTNLAALNSILDAISPKSHELDELKEKNASLKIELATERDLLHQAELKRRDKELSELKQQIDSSQQQDALIGKVRTGRLLVKPCKIRQIK